MQALVPKNLLQMLSKLGQVRPLQIDVYLAERGSLLKGVPHHLHKGQASGESLHEGQHCNPQGGTVCDPKDRLQGTHMLLSQRAQSYECLGSGII